MKKRNQLSAEEAKRIGDSLYIDWDQVDLEQFRKGLMGNHKQRSINPETEPTYDGMLLSGKVVLTHMEQFPDYFSRLEKLKKKLISTVLVNGIPTKRRHNLKNSFK